MEPANHAFFELLKFPAAQLFRVKSQEILLVHHGAFQILHNDSIDLFLLKLGHLKIALNKNLPVVGAFSDEQKYPAYLLPTFDGFYMIKIMDNTPSIALSNFETILENTCQFSRREGMEKKLGDIREPTIDTKMLVLSEMYHKAKDIIALHILPQDHHANFTLLRTFEDIQNVYGHAVEVVDVSSGEIESAKNEAEEVIRNHLSNRYWRHFSQHEGTPAGSHLGLSAFKSRISDQSEQSRLLGEERDRSESIGAANICNVKKEQEIDLQEVVGTENQRLPAYEVQNTKEHVEQGLDQASCRLDDAKFYQSCDLPPVPESQVKEDTNFTTDLLKPDEQKGLGEPLSNFDKGGDVYSQPLDSSVKDQFPTELQPRPESNMFQTLENATGDLYRRDFVQEMSLNRPPGSEKWGSDVTNPSEKMGSELGFSDAGFSATSENNGSESLGTKPVLFTGGLTHSQSLRDTSLTGNVMKENLAFKQVPSDKVEMKQKNVSEKPIEKENLTSANVV